MVTGQSGCCGASFPVFQAVSLSLSTKLFPHEGVLDLVQVLTKRVFQTGKTGTKTGKTGKSGKTGKTGKSGKTG